MQKRRKEGSKLGQKGAKLENYFHGLYKGSYPKEVEKTFAKEQSYLQVPLGEAKFLEMLVRIQKPRKILEIGTFRGFSAVFLAKYLPKGGKIWTIERDATRYEEIEELWKKTGVSKKILLIKDQALPVLQYFAKTCNRFDFFFIDASKEETIEYFKICYHKLATKGAIIVIDNTLWGGEVVDDNPKSNAARHMKKFNEYIFKHHKKDAYILPGWDGVSLVIKS